MPPRLTTHLSAFIRAFPLILYRGTAGGMPILLGLFIAHRWGLEEMAAFTLANAAIAIATVAADWGATRALPRNLAILPAEAAAEMLSSANSFRLLTVAVTLLVGAGAIAARQVDPPVARYLATLAPLCILIVATTNALSERIVAGHTRAIGYAVVSGLIVFSLLGAIVITMHLGPQWFVGAYVTGKLVEAIVLTWGRWWVLELGSGSILSTAAAFWPFSMQMILGIIYSRLAVFTVERMTTRVELGVFSVAVSLQSAMLLIPGSLALIQFPELTRLEHSGGRAGVRRVLVRYTIASVAGVSAAVVAVALLSGLLSRVLKVPEPLVPFVGAFTALAFLSIFSTMTGFLMQARGEEKRVARLSVLTLALALLYQVAALRLFGLWGIVAAVAAAELTTIVVFGAALRRPLARESAS